MKKDKKRHLTVNNLEIRSLPSNDGQSEQPVISGYAAVYNSESELLYGFFREVIRPGAFDGSLKNDIRCLWNHESSYVLGRSSAGTLDIRSDAKGLYFEVTPPHAQWATDLCESIKRGDINQMSFGFTVNEDSWQSLEDGTELRELLDVDLFEVSVVTFPAYEATSAGVRSIEEADEEIKKRYEKRNKKTKKVEKVGPEKRYFDYLKIMQAFDSRAKSDPDDDGDDDSMMDPDGDPDYDSPEEEQVKNKNRAKPVDDADGGEPEDPGSEADDPNNEDTTDDDEGDEDGSDDEKRSFDGSANPDADDTDDDLFTCDDCGIVVNGVCPSCGSCSDCCTCDNTIF